MHQHGLGGSKDYAAAIVLYAMRNRAYMHEHGLGGSKDYAAAIVLYEQAIKLGNASAMRNRAYMHGRGLGGSKDYAAAIALYEKRLSWVMPVRCVIAHICMNTAWVAQKIPRRQ